MLASAGIEMSARAGEIAGHAATGRMQVNAVQAREEPRPNRISIELLRDGPHAVVQVSDTGKGIAQGHMKRLFEPFFTTKAPGEGTGLGLNLARKIVLSHGGAIEVASELGVGSTFTVRLPAVDQDARGPVEGTVLGWDPAAGRGLDS